MVKLDKKVSKKKLVKKNLPKLTGKPPKSANLECKKAARLKVKDATKNLATASTAATTAGALTHSADIGSLSGTKGTKEYVLIIIIILASIIVDMEIIIVVVEIII